MLTVSQERYPQGSAFYGRGDYQNGATVSCYLPSVPYQNVSKYKQANHVGHPQSPPTPASAVENDDAGRRTRSGRTIALSHSPSTSDKPRPKMTPKSKKTKSGKGDKPKMAKLTAPLSILTKDMSVPVRDMKAWVNRPVEVRLKEVEKRNGYVTRPMNSFMLYRSAYAERTKQWCLQNNHQIVSSVSGESWPLEPPEVRDMYNEYAKIERINHQNAHPTYKFSPSKATALARKRKGEFSDEEELSDLDDGEWGPGYRRSRQRSFRRTERSLTYSPNSMAADYYDHSYGPSGHTVTKSAWDMAHEGRPLPMPMQGDIYNSYYQTSVHQNMAVVPNGTEDMRMRRVDSPVASMQFSSGPLLGLPGGNTVDLMESLHSSSCTPLGEPQVDPMILAFNGEHHQHHDVDSVLAQQSEFRNGHLNMMDRELEQEGVHGLLEGGTVHVNFQSWDPSPTMAPMEHGSEFDKWMDDHQAS